MKDRLEGIIFIFVLSAWSVSRFSEYKLQTVKDILTTHATTTDANEEIGDLKNIIPSSRDEADCFKPLETPSARSHSHSMSHTRILNMGFPKCGSKSISQMFSSSGFYERHNICGKQGYCGECIKKHIEENTTILENCGNFTVFSQMDVNNVRRDGRGCIYPQVQYLNELYHDSPNATWILPFRNVTNWIQSLEHWKRMKFRIASQCDFPELGFPLSPSSDKTDEDFINLYCNHVKQIRRFVNDHPSLSLVEFSIEDPNAGEYLAGVFPGVDAKAWGHANNYEEMHKESV